MSQDVLVTAGTVCLNVECPDYQVVGRGNIIGHGHSKAGVPRKYCKTCRTSFTITKGTIFYRRRTPRQDIIETLAMLAERISLSGAARVKGVKEDTIQAWLQAAAEHAAAIEAVLMRDYGLTRAQLDAMWTFVGHKGKKG